MEIKRCIIENVKLPDLPDHLRKHKLRIVRWEHWERRGWLLVTDKVQG